MLDEQDAQAPRLQHLQAAAHLLGHQGRQPFRGFIHQQQIGVAHERAAEREHLLLAAGEHARFGALARLERLKQLEHVLHAPRRAPGRPLIRALFRALFFAQQQVLAHGQARKDIAAFGHITQPQAGDFMRGPPQQRLAAPAHASAGGQQPHDGLGASGTPRAIAPQQRHDFARRHFQPHAVQHFAFAVAGAQVAHKQRHARPPAWAAA